MGFSIRPWCERDAGADREISRAVYPEYREERGHPAWFPAQQLGAPRVCASRYVAVDGNGRPVGYAALWELRPRRYRFDLAVRRERQREGIGSELFAQLLTDAATAGATGLQARIRDDKPEALQFVSRRGFREVQRMSAWRLDFAQAPVAVYAEAFDHLRRRGFEITNLAEIRARDAEHLESFYELYAAAREGWPDPDPDPNGPAAVHPEWVKRWLDTAQTPEAFFLAKIAERYVAFTSFFGIGTAVHPECRRQKIATFLKAGSIADAHRRGFHGQTTATASPGMQMVLERLGYRRVRSEIRLLRPMP